MTIDTASLISAQNASSTAAMEDELPLPLELLVRDSRSVAALQRLSGKAALAEDFGAPGQFASEVLALAAGSRPVRWRLGSQGKAKGCWERWSGSYPIMPGPCKSG